MCGLLFLPFQVLSMAYNIEYGLFKVLVIIIRTNYEI